MLRGLSLVVVGCATTVACSRFGDGGVAAHGDPDAAAEAGAGDASDAPDLDGAAATPCATAGHAFCEDFDDASGGLDAFPRWFAVEDPNRLFRVPDGVSSAPFALRAAVPAGAATATHPRLRALLPTPAKSVTCSADLRVVSAAPFNTLEIGLTVEGGAEASTALLFLGADFREVGLYRSFADGGAVYTNTTQTVAVPQAAMPVRTTFRLDLSSSPRATVSWPGADALSYPVAGRLPSIIAAARVSFGAKRNDPSGAILDVRFDDIVCDVE